MATSRIRLGIIGANMHVGWASRAHLAAARASAEFELTAVCTTRPESAAESARHFGARLAFHDYRDMVAHPDVDAVAVVVRVPSHYEPTMAALRAGKHVYTEWPLGRTTVEAQEMAAMAQARGVRTAVGLQARVSPGLMHMKRLVTDGYVGDVTSCHVRLSREGALQRTSARAWQRDVHLGANTLTIAAAHTIDAMRFVLCDFSRLSATVSTQSKSWFITDTRETMAVTAPDTVLVHGVLVNGAAASVDVASVPYAGTGYRMEIQGTQGTLVATSVDSPQLKETLLEGAREGNALQRLDVPATFVVVPDDMPRGEPYNVGQLYERFGQAIRRDCAFEPDFDTAVDLHHLIDAVRESSDKANAITRTRAGRPGTRL